MNNTAIRLCGGTLLGAGFGALCFYGFGQQPDLTPEMQAFTQWSWSNFMMWNMIANRALLGFLVGLAGFMTIHPLFKFTLPCYLRGFVMGVFASLTLSLGILIGYVFKSQETSSLGAISVGSLLFLLSDMIIPLDKKL